MTEDEALTALKSDDPALATTAEAELWTLWCHSPNPEAEKLLRAGVEAMHRRKLDEAEDCFARVIQLAPDFAEGWNKRATVHYMAKNLTESIEDCRETVVRNPNHFGALSGQGLCHMSLAQYDEAAVCFRKALEIHPHLEAARQNLSVAIKGGSGGTGYLH